MREMFFAAAASVASLATLSAAQAADIVEPPAAYDWTGPYIGLQAGYGWYDNTSVDFHPSPALAAEFAVSGGARDFAEDFDRNGFVGGAFAGYLLQRDSLVFGLEGDIEYADMNGSTKWFEGFEGTDDKSFIGDLHNDIDWLGSLRLRAGWAMDRALLYATGGLAVGDTKLKFSGEPFVTSDSDDETSWGWTIGGGIEYAIADNLSIRAEYRYTDLGSLEVRGQSTTRPELFSDMKVDQKFHAVRAGLSWHF